MGIKRRTINYGAKKIITKPHFGTLWVKKMHLKRKNLKGKERSFPFFCSYSKLRSENLPVVKEQEISHVIKKKK